MLKDRRNEEAMHLPSAWRRLPTKKIPSPNSKPSASSRYASARGNQRREVTRQRRARAASRKSKGSVEDGAKKDASAGRAKSKDKLTIAPPKAEKKERANTQIVESRRSGEEAKLYHSEKCGRTHFRHPRELPYKESGSDGEQLGQEAQALLGAGTQAYIVCETSLGSGVSRRRSDENRRRATASRALIPPLCSSHS